MLLASTIGTYLNPRRNLLREFYKLQEHTRTEWIAQAEADGDGEPARLDRQGRLLPRITLQDLRHLHASACIRQNMNPKLLADRLGHSHTSMTLDVCTHLFEEQRADCPVGVSTWVDSAGPMN